MIRTALFAAAVSMAGPALADDLVAEGEKLVAKRCKSCHTIASADEVFMSGNMMKVTPVTGFEDTSYQIGPITRRVRELYWDWAHSG